MKNNIRILIALPLFISFIFTFGMQMEKLAKDIKALAHTSRELYYTIQSPNIMIAILQSLPYTAQAIDLADQLKKLPVMQTSEITSWLATAKSKLVDGISLIVAAKSCLNNNVKELLENRNTDFNYLDSFGRTALVEAATENNVEATELLLAAGANPNIENASRTTALMRAYDHVEITQKLLAAGADPNIQDTDGNTALMKATDAGFKKVVQVLLNSGANPNIENFNGFTALKVAAEKGFKGIVQRFLSAGANPNSKDHYNKTPLMKAAFNGHKEIVQILLDAGANPNLKDSYRKTAQDYTDDTDIKNILKAAEERAAQTTTELTPAQAAAEAAQTK